MEEDELRELCDRVIRGQASGTECRQLAAATLRIIDEMGGDDEDEEYEDEEGDDATE